MGTVFRLNSELPTPEAGTKIVKADEYSAVLEAGDLIKAAQKQADEIIQAAQRTYEQRYQQGYDDGVEAVSDYVVEYLVDIFSISCFGIL